MNASPDQAWALLVAGVGIIVLLVAMLRRRLSSALALERSRHDDLLRRRERTARELHDTLLQDMQGFVLKIQAATNLVAADSPARRMLDDSLARADLIMAQGRDRIQHMRMLGIEACDLPEALEGLGRALSKTGGAHFSIKVEGEARAMQSGVADDLYQIAREAMSNAFRHAEPAEVEIQLLYAREVFRLRIRDNGSGFNPALQEGEPAFGCWGLPGMRERAQRIGARLCIRSHPGVGTDVELQMTPDAAYAHAAAGPTEEPK